MDEQLGDEALLSMLWAPESEPFGTEDSPLAGRSDAGVALELQELWTEPWDELLAPVDALESDSTPDARPLASAICPTSDPLPTASSYTPPARRVTMKHRIQLLKTEAERLQVNLKVIRQNTRHTKPTIGSRERGSASREAGMWQSIAARQQHQREQAETENKRLRSLVHAQRRHLQNVRRLLGRRPHRHVSLDDDASGLIEMATHPFTSIARCGAFNRR
jgi:hypothetical protein